MTRLTDLHQHVLWGMDDGPSAPQAMYAMLDLAVQQGISLIAATSHAYPQERAFDRALYTQRLDEANAYCQSRGWPLTLIGGCEILWCDRAADLLRAGALPMLGNTRHVLLEFFPDTKLHEIARAAEKTYKAGCFPIIAHVERYRALRGTIVNPLRFKEDYGLIYQMNCDTLLAPRTLMERLFVRRMLEEQAIDLVASDAHDTVLRPVRMRQAYEQVKDQYDQAYAEELFTFGARMAVLGEDEGKT
ncbi:MAG: hypothetical protein IKB82_04665 [Clostridia bacterium]|nr:hypothetical protein [Clostridia bacterium]